MSKILKVVGASWLQTKISSYILGILGALSILALFIGQMERIQEDGNYAATVFYSEKTGYRIEYWGQSNELAEIPKGVARAYFRMDIDTEGWSMLEVETDGSYSDEKQAYAAGIVEGALTWYLIHTHLKNTILAKCDGQANEKQCEKLRDHLDKSVNKWKVYAAEREDENPFWHHVSLYYTQMSGVYTGWKHGVERSMNEFETDISDLYWLNYYAEVTEIQHKLNISIDDPDLEVLPGLSSAFVRVVNDSSSENKPKIFVAHNAAGSYSSMTRIMKRYKLNYHKTSEDTEPVPGTTIDFSSYPGSITSQDEFYLIRGNNHKMAVTGTSLTNFNSDLWKDVNITEQVPVGPRIRAANHLASNVSSWGHLLAASNSGTACKQWMVIDLTKFDQQNFTNSNHEALSAKKDITETTVEHGIRHTHVVHSGHAKGLMLLIEQVPARTHSADLSDVLLEQGFWATFGIPVFKDISEATHVNKMEEQYGSVYSDTKAPRAIMFREGYINATTLHGVTRLMRQNNMTENNKKDLVCSDAAECMLGPGGYLSVLAVRGDIVDHHKQAYGVIDTKVIVGSAKQSTLQLIAISGPTYTEVKVNNSNIPQNKGTVASTYTDKFDDASTINGLEIRDHVKQQIEEAEQESIERYNANVIKPFEWSESDFKEYSREGLPDKWNFAPFTPKWSW